MKKVIAIYPGSFDPPTNGHLDLIERGSNIFDELVVAILRNSEKSPLFSLGERRAMLESMTGAFRSVRVDTFDGLTVDYALRVRAKAILRGIRAISDYEYELQMALMNRKLHPELETVFMMPAEQYSYLSSRLVREVAQLGGRSRPCARDGRNNRKRMTQSRFGEREKTKGRQTSMSPVTETAHHKKLTDRTHQSHSTFRHHGGGGRSRQAAPAGRRRGGPECGRAAFSHAAAY